MNQSAFEDGRNSQARSLDVEESERRLREAQFIAGLGSFHWDAKTNRVTWSDQLYRIYGKSPKQFVPSFENYLSCVHPDDRARVLDGLQQAMATRGEFAHEYRALKSDDSFCWVQARGRAIVSDQGELLGIEGTCQDTTERKKAEIGMTDALDRLEKIASRVPGMVYEFRRRTDGTSSFPYASEGMRNIFQVGPEEVKEDGSKILNCIHPADSERIELSIQESARAMLLWNQEFRVRRSDNTERWVSGNSAPTRESDGSTLWHGYLADVTDRKRSEIALQISEAKFRAIINASPVPMAITDKFENVSYLNPAFVESFGYEQNEIPTLSEWKRLAYPDPIYRQQAVDLCNSNIDVCKETSRTSTTTELVVHCRNGSKRTVVVSATPLHDGFSEAILFMLQDVSEQKEAAERLVVARAAAEAASLAKSAFLANMSHEIRTPLTAILGFAEILGEDGTLEQPAEHRGPIVETIRKAGTHLLTIINDILDLSKIEANRMTIEKVESPLISLLIEVETLLSPVAKGKGVQLQFRLSNLVPDRILCDPTRLRQILLNLVGNSTKFTESGRIDVNVGTMNDSEISWLIIDVEDTGPGISTELVEQLFTPFRQGDTSMTRMYGGTGLGLSISRRFANLLGGDIQLMRNEIGKGACFRIQLPLEPAKGSEWFDNLELVKKSLSTSSTFGQPTALKHSLQGRILFAEDGIDNQRLIAFHLRSAGAIVETADNGRIALDMIDKAEAEGNPFDMLLTDMQMPEMDGYTLAKILRERGSTMVILALTANSMSEDRDKCIEAGCDDYSSKPINKEMLLAKCATWLKPRSRACEVHRT